MDFPSGQTLRHSDFLRDEEVRCDAVVVGSGAGGAAAAWVLSQKGHRVALLEEGRKWEPEELSTKPSWAYRHLYQERSTRFMMGNLYIPLPGGRAVGGSTLLNSAICFRTPARILKRWQDEFGIPWADPRTLDPVFTEVEREIGVAKTDPSQARTNNLIFKQGADALALPGDFISRNAPGCVGCGLCQLGCPIGAKGSVDRNMIPESLERGAALFTSVRAVNVLVENGAAVGVVARVLDPMTEKPIRTLTVRAKKVVLSGGPVGTPLLLLKNGLANSSGQVGKNLYVHCASGVVAQFPQIIDAWDGVTQGYYVDLPEQNAVLETFSSTPDLYYTHYRAFAQPPETIRHLASCGVMLGDESKGEVAPGPAEGRSAISYSLSEIDKKRLLVGMRTIAKIYFAAGAMRVHAGIHHVGTVGSMRELEAVTPDDIPAEKLSVYASHPMGTCRMGADKSRCVVAPTGETHDVRNLFIADASLFPTSLGVNPQITVMTTSVVVSRQAAQAG